MSIKSKIKYIYGCAMSQPYNMPFYLSIYLSVRRQLYCPGTPPSGFLNTIECNYILEHRGNLTLHLPLEPLYVTSQRELRAEAACWAAVWQRGLRRLRRIMLEYFRMVTSGVLPESYSKKVQSRCLNLIIFSLILSFGRVKQKMKKCTLSTLFGWLGFGLYWYIYNL